MNASDKFCCERVNSSGAVLSRQCRNKSGFGPDKRYCKTHDPAMTETRRRIVQERCSRRFAERTRAINVDALLTASVLFRKDGDSLTAVACRNLAHKIGEGTGCS